MSPTAVQEKLTIENDTDVATPAPAGRSGNLRRLVLAGVAGLVVVGLIVVVVVLGLDYRNDRAAEQARGDAMDAASRQAVAMLSYDFNSVDTELPKAADGLTGDFRDQYTALIQQAIIPGAKEKQLVVKVDVSAASIVSASPDDATVLLFLDQVTTSKDNPQAVTTGSRIRVLLQHVDGRWKVSQLTPI